MKKRYAVEFGMGADIHGEDVTKAVKKAIRDAVSHSCLSGITDIMGIEDLSKMEVHIKVGCPHPERVERDAVLAAVPVGTPVIDSIEDGGLSVKGVHLDALGEGDDITIALVALTVYLDI